MGLFSVAFAVDDPEIREHLLSVVETLRRETPSTLDQATRYRRASALEALESYAWAGDFPEVQAPGDAPRNVLASRQFHAYADQEQRRPRFIDPDGTHCAVGYLVALDRPELAAQINDEHEWDWLADIRTSGVSEWAEFHGLTLDELAWIQPNYSPLTVGRCELSDPATFDVDDLNAEACGLLFDSNSFVCADACDVPVSNFVKVHWTGSGLVTVTATKPEGDEEDQDVGVSIQATLVPGESAWIGPLDGRNGERVLLDLEVDGEPCEGRVRNSAVGTGGGLDIAACSPWGCQTTPSHALGGWSFGFVCLLHAFRRRQ